VIWVRVAVAASAGRHNVAVCDRLPAGFEFVRPPADRGCSSVEGVQAFTKGQPVEVMRTRDLIAVFYSEITGAAAFEYAAMAVTPGMFTAPPAHAEEMYCPEVFGRTGVTKWSVE
jgi:alpha-2-macroglobulin